MKKLMLMGLLAVSCLFVAERPAQAWVNCRFNVGLNWVFQCGHQNDFWNMYNAGMLPGGGPIAESVGGPVYTSQFPSAGLNYMDYGPAISQAPPRNNAAPPAATAARTMQPAAYFQPSAAPPTWQTQNYQPASYQPVYQPSYQPGYWPGGYGQQGNGGYFPGYYGYYQPPSYWYGYGR